MLCKHKTIIDGPQRWYKRDKNNIFHCHHAAASMGLALLHEMLTCWTTFHMFVWRCLITSCCLPEDCPPSLCCTRQRRTSISRVRSLCVDAGTRPARAAATGKESPNQSALESGNKELTGEEASSIHEDTKGSSSVDGRHSGSRSDPQSCWEHQWYKDMGDKPLNYISQWERKTNPNQNKVKQQAAAVFRTWTWNQQSDCYSWLFDLSVEVLLIK